jgi:catechol 2,3-dioxygenase-like lactoylglutathione lyase family enzyme
VLTTSRVIANIPAADLQRARAFYADKLGLVPASEMAGPVLLYHTDGGTDFSLYETAFAGQAGHTIAQWHVEDIDSEVHDLTAKGVEFEVYDDMPGVTWDGPIASLPGVGRAAWFKDSEGNTMCIDQGEQPG